MGEGKGFSLMGVSGCCHQGNCPTAYSSNDGEAAVPGVTLTTHPANTQTQTSFLLGDMLPEAVVL